MKQISLKTRPLFSFEALLPHWKWRQRRQRPQCQWQWQNDSFGLLCRRAQKRSRKKWKIGDDLCCRPGVCLLQLDSSKLFLMCYCLVYLQGPAGYTPVCNCGPLLKRLEQRMDGERATMYDHIDASHRTLADRIDHLDRRAAQQIYALDKLTRDRLDSERQDAQDRVEKRLLREKLETERQLDRRGEHLRNEIKAWVDNRLTNFEQQYGNFHADCSDDLLHGRTHRHGAPQPGALFRSRSDETLSLSSQHPTKKHARLYAKAIHDLKKMRANGQKMDKRTRGLAVRDHPLGAQNGPASRPMTFHEDLSPIAGRSPEGQSGNGEFSEGEGHDSLKLNSTAVWSQSQRRNYNEAEGKSPSDSSNSTSQLKENFAKMNITEKKTPHPQGINTTTVTPTLHQAFAQPHPEKSATSSTPNQPSFTMASFNDDYQHTGYNVRHFNTESGSIPDSGYGGKGPYGKALNDGHQDQHNSSMATTASTEASSPMTLASTSDASSEALSPQYSTGVANLREKWFKSGPTQNTSSRPTGDNRLRPESEGAKSKARTFDDNTSSDRIRMNPAIASKHGTEVWTLSPPIALHQWDCLPEIWLKLHVSNLYALPQTHFRPTFSSHFHTKHISTKNSCQSLFRDSVCQISRWNMCYCFANTWEKKTRSCFTEMIIF